MSDTTHVCKGKKTLNCVYITLTLQSSVFVTLIPDHYSRISVTCVPLYGPLLCSQRPATISYLGHHPVQTRPNQLLVW
jgi:hypothetical protein